MVNQPLDIIINGKSNLYFACLICFTSGRDLFLWLLQHQLDTTAPCLCHTQMGDATHDWIPTFSHCTSLRDALTASEAKSCASQH